MPFYLSLPAFYKLLLDNLSTFSLRLEKGNISLCEISLAPDITVKNNEELLSSSCTHLYCLEQSVVEVDEVESGNKTFTVAWKLFKTNHAKRLPLNREFQNISCDGMKSTVQHNELHVNSVGEVNNCLKSE